MALTVLLGFGFRLSYLDQKFAYGDEVVSSLRESGHTEADFARVFDGRVRTAADISWFLADRSTAPRDVVRSLAAEDPQHPPLFYLANRYWTQAFGDTTGGRRMLAALFGCAALLAVFWLGLELFGSLEAAAIAAALVAVSPFHVIYSQQNREYSAWLFFLAVSSALLLRALRRDTAAAWVGYAAVLALALYTDALVLYDVLSFCLFVALVERKWTVRARAFTLATGAGLLAYAPWFLVLYRGAGTITGWKGPLRQAVSAQIYTLKWLFNTGAVFFDSEYENARLIPVAAIVLAIVAFSLFAVARSGSPRTKSFVLSLAGVPAVLFIAADLLAHTSRATASRYLVPVWLGCELAVAYAIASLLVRAGATRSARVAAASALAFLIVCGTASNLRGLPERQTTATAEMGRLGPEAQSINATGDPLVVYVHDGQHWDIGVAMLATVLRPGVRIALFDDVSHVRIRDPEAGFFLYAATPDTKASVERATGGRWNDIADDGFGSGLVYRLRLKASSDRGNAADALPSATDLWQRLPDLAASARPGPARDDRRL